ncbi:helix-hairpin-helix domain-containing protein [Isoptericola haloaureus]|uniref:Helix-hairpin-helix domain-containing protein n=1 Tax=Isoptericola haloaureus TaxID=1542902 RepID=A0ABU7ZB78_9MICO
MTTAHHHPPEPPDATDDPAGGRLEALRAALATPADDGGPDELVERLRARRSGGHVAAAYSAAHGHPVDDAPDGGRRRWALAGPVATAAAVVLLALGLVVGGVALWPRQDVAPLGVPVGGAPADPAPGDPPRAGPASVDPAPAGTPPGPTSLGAGAGGAGGSATGTGVVVHVIGQVADPGLVTVPTGARVADAVEAAGGATGTADLTALNLARSVVDGEQVHVPAPGEEPRVAAPLAGTAAGADAAAPVPLNAADATALTALPGVGPVLADRIVAWRDEHGPFTRFDELAEVSGIGPVLLEELRDLVVL